MTHMVRMLFPHTTLVGNIYHVISRQSYVIIYALFIQTGWFSCTSLDHTSVCGLYVMMIVMWNLIISMLFFLKTRSILREDLINVFIFFFAVWKSLLLFSVLIHLRKMKYFILVTFYQLLDLGSWLKWSYYCGWRKHW